MGDDSNNGNNSGSGHNRRSSIAGDTFASIFGTRRSNSLSGKHNQSVSENANASQPTQQYPGPISTAAAQAQRRRLSLTTYGLPASNQTSPFNRRESAGSNNSGSIDESAMEDDVSTAGPTPQTPFGRRMSFGAKALRDVRGSTGGGGNGGGGGGGGEQNEGFNWSDNFSTRAERTSNAAVGQTNSPPAAAHNRAKSVAVMEAPVKDMPKPKEPQRPDHFQERILKGDFYMD